MEDPFDQIQSLDPIKSKIARLLTVTILIEIQLVKYIIRGISH